MWREKRADGNRVKLRLVCNVLLFCVLGGGCFPVSLVATSSKYCLDTDRHGVTEVKLTPCPIPCQMSCVPAFIRCTPLRYLNS